MTGHHPGTDARSTIATTLQELVLNGATAFWAAPTVGGYCRP
ncbi:hypothetical protein F4553_002593 [Allocatelliglobosispora scoriae]|uniref:Uncharacterized protein n=1 Tax=Allocatelliglobosispora scoriae TaxID=643052 RepID=A0A841BLP9_9ACTN|nr:hypothetical protein [Allocatelliglobosispora scoriae]MBB5869214.1 hypothetical protein [Allocatelliglobosispora scoriae]